MSTPARGLLAAVLLAAAAPLAAQAPQGGARPPAAPQQAPGTISGRVVDAEGAPVPSAQVAVWSAADSTLVTGAVVRPDGSFRVQGVRPGRYFLRVSALGYASTATGVLTVTPEALQADAGVVRVAQAAVLMEELTVSAEAAPATFQADRNSYRVRDLPATAGGNAGDVLRNVPAVEVDQDGRVSLRGNPNVAVQINGRPAPMSGEQLGNFLAQLPAAMLERVEVIPNPSARYEPEGMAGIINIVMRQNTDLGTSYGLMAGVGTGGRYNTSANVGYQRGPLTLFGSYGLRRDERLNSGANLMERYGVPGGAPVSYLDQTVDGGVDIFSHLFNGSADYRLSARDVLSGSVMLSRGRFDNAIDNVYLEMDADRVPVRRYTGENRVDARNLVFDGTLALRRTFRPREHELSGEVRLGRNRNLSESRFEERVLFGEGAGTTEPRLEGIDGDRLSGIFTAQADYTRTLASRTRVETGWKATLRTVDEEQEHAAYDGTLGRWVRNDARSSRFEYEDLVNAGYLVLSRGFGRVETQAGLRAEHTGREFYLAESDERFPKDYWSFFPSAHASMTLDPRRQVRVSYSRRVQRPPTRLLNPLPMTEDQLNRMVGNPELEPEYTHAMEATYQHSFSVGSVQVTPFFRRTENVMRRIAVVRGDTTVATIRNLDSSDSYGADLNASLRRGRLTAMGSFSGFRMVTEAGNVDDALSSASLVWFTRFSGSFQVNPRLDLQASVMYRAPLTMEQGRVGSMSSTSFAVRQRVLGDRGSVSLRLAEPLSRQGFSVQIVDPLYLQNNRRDFGGRAAFLNFSYSVGQQPRLRPRTAPQEEATPSVPGIAP
jgi:ferric enterobactin receptor